MREPFSPIIKCLFNRYIMSYNESTFFIRQSYTVQSFRLISRNAESIKLSVHKRCNIKIYTSLLFYSIFRGAPRRVYENETLSARAKRETGLILPFWWRPSSSSSTGPVDYTTALSPIRRRRRPLKIHLDCHSMGSFCRRSGG